MNSRDQIIAAIVIAGVLALLVVCGFGFFSWAVSGGTFDQLNEVVGKLSAVRSHSESIAVAIKQDGRFAHARSEAEALYADAKTASDGAIDMTKAGVTNNFSDSDVATVLDLVASAQRTAAKLRELAATKAQTGDHGSAIDSLPEAAATVIGQVGELVDSRDSRQRAANLAILESVRMRPWRELPGETGAMR